MKTQQSLQKIWIFVAVAAIAAALSSSSFAIPVPHGITGTVYGLDGVTQVPAGIDFNISNAANSFVVNGKTGRGAGTGSYAASVAGDDGNTIIVTAWNIEHSSTKIVTLEGVMRNVTFLLNMTLKPYAPNITTTPAITALEGALYQYDADATDYNFDKIEYSLFSAPPGMAIDRTTGLVQWTPKNADVGENLVTIIASDGNLTGSQTFIITVENVNDAPEITSIPETAATVNKQYTYQINATDPDNETLLYSLLQAPDKMEISSTGLVAWTPRKQDVGNSTIIVQASDGILTATQMFSINVADFTPPGQIRTSSSSSSTPSLRGGGGFITAATGTTRQQLLAAEDKSTPIKKLLIKFRSPVESAGVKVLEISAKPEGVSAIQKRVYKYIEITAQNFNNSNVEEATIQFVVQKKWLENNGISPENIVLSHYSGSGWEELPTAVESETASEYSYTSKTNRFSVFAITIKSEKSLKEVNSEINTALSTGIRETYAIAGYILKSNGKLQADEGTPFTITNTRTNDSVSGKTGIGQATGAFLAIIPGNKGDALLMKAGSISKAEGTFVLTGDMTNLAAIAKGTELVFLETPFSNTIDTKVTGYITAIHEAPKSAFAAFAFLIIMAAAIIYNRRKATKAAETTKKRPRKRQRKTSRKTKKRKKKRLSRKKR